MYCILKYKYTVKIITIYKKSTVLFISPKILGIHNSYKFFIILIIIKIVEKIKKSLKMRYQTNVQLHFPNFPVISCQG